MPTRNKIRRTFPYQLACQQKYQSPEIHGRRIIIYFARNYAMILIFNDAFKDSV